MKIRTLLFSSIFLLAGSLANAADYMIDTKGMHAFVQFKVQHLGYSWLHGQFNDFSGEFSYDAENPAASKASVVINTASLDTNHAKRDEHLRGDEFLDVKKYPQIKFTSTSFSPEGDNAGTLHGDLTLHGVTKPVAIKVTKIGEGDDPWGGYRAGFSGYVAINRSDFGVDKNLGPASEKIEITLSVEGVRK